jgi:hypothetical protein
LPFVLYRKSQPFVPPSATRSTKPPPVAVVAWFLGLFDDSCRQSVSSPAH